MMGYSIFMERKWAEGGKGGEEDKETMDGDERKEAKERKKKLQYEKWRDDRGVLLSKSEQEKQKVLVASMANMAASFGKRRLELKKRV